MNEVARTQDMSKLLDQPIVATDDVVSRGARRPGFRLHDLGAHDLRGIPVAKRLWAVVAGEPTEILD